MFWLEENVPIIIKNVKDSTKIELVTNDVSLGGIIDKNSSMYVDGKNKETTLMTKKNSQVQIHASVLSPNDVIIDIDITGKTNGEVKIRITDNSIDIIGIKNVKIEAREDEKMINVVKEFNNINYTNIGRIYIYYENDKIDIDFIVI